MKRLARFAVTLGAWLAAAPGSASAQGGGTSRVLYKEVVVEAPIERVWHAWTTEEGIRFISNQSRIEIEVGGAYELFLDGPVESDGRRGAEGARVLAFVPHEMLAFTWTFPAAVMELRAADERTHVVVMLDSLGRTETRVRLYSIGWGEGPAWDQGFAYFDRAWGFVLDLLKQSLESADVGAATGWTPPPSPAVRSGVWLANTTVYRGETVAMRDSTVLEVRSTVKDAVDAWLIVERAAGERAGVDSTWIRASDLSVLATHGANPHGESWSRREDDGHIMGSVVGHDGAASGVEIAASAPAYSFASIPLLLAAFEGEVGDSISLPVVDLHQQKVSLFEGALLRESPEGERTYLLEVDGAPVDLSFAVTLRASGELARVEVTGPNGFRNETVYSRR